MTRVKRAYVAKRRRNGISAITARSKQARSRLSRTVQQQAIKSLTYSYKDRNKRKRDFRHLWIVRINAAARNTGISYSKFINRVKKLDIVLNRKMLSQIAVFNNNNINSSPNKDPDKAPDRDPERIIERLISDERNEVYGMQARLTIMLTELTSIYRFVSSLDFEAVDSNLKKESTVSLTNYNITFNNI